MALWHATMVLKCFMVYGWSLEREGAIPYGDPVSSLERVFLADLSYAACGTLQGSWGFEGHFAGLLGF